MSRTDEILLFVVYLAILGILYGIARNSARRQKGLLFGVTVPETALELPQVQALIRRFQRETDFLALAMVPIYIPLFFLHTMWLLLSVWILLFYAAITVPYLPYLKAHKQMKQLKKEQGWAVTPPLRLRAVDTNASEAALPKPIGLWTLVLPLVLCLLPIALPGLPLGLMLACGIDAACVLLLWALGRWTFRRREDMVTEDSARNQTLLRVRQLYWDRFWRLNLWAMALLNLFLPLGYRSEAAILGFTLGFTVLLLAGSLWMEFSVRRAQAALTADTTVVADEDDAWVGGLFYYDPTDKRFMVSKRLGIGTTVNLGTLAGKIYMSVVALILVAVVAIGPILGIVDSIPVRLELSGNAPVCLVASHGQSEKYRLDTDAITDVQLRDTLPDAARTWGVGMDHYLQGDFYVAGEGNAQFCLDPTQKCFLRVEANGQVYWFTGDTAEKTEAIAQVLETAGHS